MNHNSNVAFGSSDELNFFKIPTNSGDNFAATIYGLLRENGYILAKTFSTRKEPVEFKIERKPIKNLPYYKLILNGDDNNSYRLYPNSIKKNGGLVLKRVGNEDPKKKETEAFFFFESLAHVSSNRKWVNRILEKSSQVENEK